MCKWEERLSLISVTCIIQTNGMQKIKFVTSILKFLTPSTVSFPVYPLKVRTADSASTINLNLPSFSIKWGHHFLSNIWPSISNSFAGPSYGQFWYLPNSSLLHCPYHTQWYSSVLTHCKQHRQFTHKSYNVLHLKGNKL